jgi:hypothetical protein
MALDRHIAIDMRAMHACMRHSLFTVLLSSPLLSSPLAAGPQRHAGQH